MNNNMKKLPDKYQDYYYLTEDGILYNKEKETYKRADKRKSFSLKTKQNTYENVQLRTLYKQVFQKNFYIDDIQDLDGEIWKEIENTNGIYFVSNKGRIKSLSGYKARLLTLQERKRYQRIDIRYKNGDSTIRKSKFVHRLVADAFLESPPSIEWELHHKDVNPSNNAVENLVWLDPIEHRKIHQKLKHN